MGNGSVKSAGFGAFREHVLRHVVRREMAQAIDLLEGWLRSHPDEGDARVLLAMIRLAQGDMERAVADLMMCIDIEHGCVVEHGGEQ